MLFLPLLHLRLHLVLLVRLRLMLLLLLLAMLSLPLLMLLPAPHVVLALKATVNHHLLLDPQQRPEALHESPLCAILFLLLLV